MQRHGNDDVGSLDQVSTGARHPLREMYGHIGSVTVFQLQNQRTAFRVIEKHSPCAAKGRPVGNTGPANEVLCHAGIERHTTDAAIGSSDKCKAPKARRAKLSRRGDDRAARQALRRQDRIEQHAPGLATGPHP